MSENAQDLMTNMFGVFGQKVEDVKVQEEETGTKLQMFKPDPTTTGDKIWRGVVKFLPNLEAIDKPMIKKTTYWMTDPTTQKGFLYESPKSVGKYEKCIVANAYWDWKESKDARLVAESEKLSYSRKCFAMVQVIKDMQDPSNNGKIMLWNLPHKIQKMIDARMYPSKEDIDMGELPHNPFDPFTGQTMTLKIGLNEYGRDWDSVSWSKETVPTTMILAGESEPVKLSTDSTELKKQQEAALQTILDSEVKLSEVVYKPADEATLKRVQDVLNLMAGKPVNANVDTQVQAEQPTTTNTTVDVQNEAPTTSDDDFMNDVMNG